jgi:putative MATE family efflux protein
MNKKERDKMLGTEKISKLIAKLSIPAIAAMLVMTLYNLVDTIYVGKGVGPLAIGGLTIVFPFQMIVMALAMMVGVGAASVVSRKLGEGDHEKAYKAAGNAFTISTVFGVLITAAGFLFFDNILSVFGVTDKLMKYSSDYLSVILMGTVFITFTMSANNIVRAEGHANVAMATMLVGAVTNIILDPVFIFGFGLGVKGAALATVISQVLSCIFLLQYFMSGKSTIYIKPANLIPDFSLLKEMFSLGISAFIRQSGMSLVLIAVNNSLGFYGGEVLGNIYISVFGLVFRILSVILMPLFGLVQGFQPIAGFNYGAGNLDRVKETVKVSLRISIIIGSIGFAVLMLFPELALKIFTDSTEEINLIQYGAPVLRIAIILIPLVGLQIIGSTYFLAIGKAGPAFFLGLSRQFVCLLPFILILPLFFGLWGVFYAFPVADFLSTAITGIWLLRDVRHLQPRLSKAV